MTDMTQNWEKALDDLKSIASGDYQVPEKRVLAIFCYKIDPRLENRRECKMLTHKKGTAAPYGSKKGAYPYLLAEVEVDKLTENGKKFLEVWRGDNVFATYKTSVLKGDECIIPSMRGQMYSYNPREFFRTEQICIGETGTEFINRCAERLENQGCNEKEAWIDRAKRIADKAL